MATVGVRDLKRTVMVRGSGVRDWRQEEATRSKKGQCLYPITRSKGEDPRRPNIRRPNTPVDKKDMGWNRAIYARGRNVRRLVWASRVPPTYNVDKPIMGSGRRWADLFSKPRRRPGPSVRSDRPDSTRRNRPDVPHKKGR
ncbi:hypothetical protein PIB30_015230 [Stylosanthes scabra]|uniref:Uncharacterized protein n=1 Tax=Stylosanthes scabra TaxID=79078 RepID=A0ABU6X5A5_9FABA|nr:hypothetical protein [Stylosanthes scabra]